jgi:FtsP/CotA-like multicopper oxidase with cupredoxin domain
MERTRRDFLALTGFAFGTATFPDVSEPDIKLRIAPITLDLAPGHSVKTLAYNGQVPGPLLRVREGQQVVVEVQNDTDSDDMVHWHGLHIPSNVDGVHEEGTPHVPRRGSQRYTFTPKPSGTRWYHSHITSGRNFQTGTYTGQFGMMIVEPRDDRGSYDQEVPIILHEWVPRLVTEGAVDVEYSLFSINGKMLGGGDPVRVRRGRRVLFRILNASATMIHRLALPGHVFNVIALDGNMLAAPRSVTMLEIGPGERIDAIVEMNQPGVWIFGETRDAQRKAGMGVAVEYAGESGAPLWAVLPPTWWDYLAFGNQPALQKDVQKDPDEQIPLVFRPRGDYQWTINGKSFPHTDPIRVRAGRRYSMIFDNQSAHPHPVHLHRHTFEIIRVADQPTSGIRKDVVVVPPWRQVKVALTADNPGLTLLHCHQQFHMDFGFMALMQYEE